MSSVLKDIDEFLANPEWSLLLYAMFFDHFNRFYDQGRQIIIFEFSSPSHLLTWLRSGTNNGKSKVLGMSYDASLKVVPKKHRPAILQTQTVKGLAICITCSDQDGDIWTGVVAVSRVQSLNNLQYYLDKYQVHAKSIVVLT